jgi:hypothetical protein
MTLQCAAATGRPAAAACISLAPADAGRRVDRRVEVGLRISFP